MNHPHSSIVTRSVWSWNLEAEFELIRSVITSFPLISMDSEFPGVIVPNNPAFRKAEDNYTVLKANVDCLHLIQVGLTFSDSEGNLPNLGTSDHFIWEFNFCDFDVTRDLYAPDSIAFLRRQGIDFEMNRRFGIDTVRFAQLMKYSGLVCNNNIQWITFQGAYDFGYLVKALTGRVLPEEGDYFLQLVKAFFGVRVYDVKHLMRFCPNLYGGLDRICQSLNLERPRQESVVRALFRQSRG
ncbi:putative CCR4-associated factor 1-like 11, partial [Mucuna pruriens]